jgi:hypothetical protein
VASITVVAAGAAGAAAGGAATGAHAANAAVPAIKPTLFNILRREIIFGVLLISFGSFLLVGDRLQTSEVRHQISEHLTSDI